MKKIILFAIASCLICNLSFSQTDEKKEKKASKLGSFLKKTVEATTGLNVSDEIYMTQENNKLVGEADIGFVGCYGDSKTGNVYLVLTVNFHNDDGKFSLSIPAAVSSKGKVYKNDKSLTDIGIELDGIEITYTVKGLKYGMDFDIFSDLSVYIKDGQLLIDNDKCSNFVKDNVDFFIKNQLETYKEGDTVIVGAHIDMNAATDNGYNIEKTEQEYILKEQEKTND